MNLLFVWNYCLSFPNNPRIELPHGILIVKKRSHGINVDYDVTMGQTICSPSTKIPCLTVKKDGVECNPLIANNGI